MLPDWEFKQVFLDAFARSATETAPTHNAFDTIRSKSILTLQERLWPAVYLNSVRNNSFQTLAADKL